MIFADNSFLYFFNLYHNKKSNTNKKGLYNYASQFGINIFMRNDTWKNILALKTPITFRTNYNRYNIRTILFKFIR